MTLPTVGVCGFGRCGSTMVMTMLGAGGIPPVPGADSRSHELDFALAAELAPAVLAARAVKLLDSILYPEHAPLPSARRWMFVWLDRDPHQQARSQVKLLHGIGLRVPAIAVKKLEESYAADRPRALAALCDLGPVHVDRYERALSDPAAFAADLAAFLGPELPLDPSAAASVIHRRDARCASTLEFEQTGRAAAATPRLGVR
jgi:hypothetical protein